MTELTREQLIEAAKKAGAQAEGPLSRPEFERITGISQYHIYRLFPEGGWSELKQLAELERHPKDNQPLTDDELLEEFHSVATKIGRIPTWALFNHHAQVSADVVRRRFGGLQGTLKQYRDWLQAHHPDSNLLTQLATQSRHELPPPPEALAETTASPSETWTKVQGPEYGPPIDFRGLRHAPINEQGVVFLFGMVSYELGFIVEAVHADFPDCEAKRCIDSRNQRWQRVRIEFEYKSRNFKEHGHDPGQCDLIICWEHNWPDCPLEVVELRRVINELEG
ncbi:MAG: homing endonuclease associated repeat-containing protein [Acidobacteriota bacterium]